jgi:hypothetical protein
LAPGRSAVRLMLIVLAGVFGSLGVLSLEGLAVQAPVAASCGFVAASTAAFAALIPAPYGVRAGLAVIAGLLPLVLGARGQGPLAALGSEGQFQAGAGLVLSTLLPAALFFRAQYRAFTAAKGILAGVLVLAAPAVLFLGRGALAEGAPTPMRLVDGLMIAAALTSLGGFLGPETTGACTLWGGLVLATTAAHAFAISWLLSGGDALSACAVGVGVGAAATVAGMGVYQLLAALFAGRARLVDIHQIVGPSAEEEEPEG